MLLGGDALGRLALGQIGQSAPTTTVMVATGAALALSSPAVKFVTFEAAATGSLALSPVVNSEFILAVAGGTSLALSPIAVSFKQIEAISPGGLAGSGQAATFELFQISGGSGLTLTPIDAQLSRTGGDYDAQQGGIGHFLYEQERAKQLAAITRNPPPPIDTRTVPQFNKPRPLPAPPVAPIAPVVDMAAVQSQRMAAQAAAVQATKKRREIEAILLLAS